MKSPISVRIIMRAKTWGGMEGNNVQLAVRLARQGVDVTYTALGKGVYSLMPSHYARELEVEEIDWPWDDPVPFRKWYRMMRERPADVGVFPKDWWSKGGVSMLAAAAMVYDRVVVREHVAMPAVEPPRRRGGLIAPVWYYRHRAYGRLLSTFPDRIICVSETVRNRLVQGGAFSSGTAVTVHNGIDCELFRFDPISRADFRSQYGITDDVVVFGAVSRIDCGTKRHDLSLRAFARLASEHPDDRLHFLLVGDGPDHGKMLDLAAELGVSDRFTIAPFTPSPWQAYSALDVFLMPSAFEAFGLALAEAMASERCVIGMGTGGIAEILSEPGIGWCVPPDDEAAFYRAMQAALDSGDEGRRIIGAAARASIVRRFDAEQQYRRIIDHVLGTA